MTDHNAAYNFYWHSFFLAVTMTFTELNTVMPALIVQSGGGAVAVGALTAIMLGLPLAAQFLFAGFIQSRPRKRPYLLLGINLRVLALGAAALVLTMREVSPEVTIALVFMTMAVFAASGSLAGLPYTHLVGSFIVGTGRQSFFVLRQVATSAGLLVSAFATRWILARIDYPRSYVVLFVAAALFLFVAALGFWLLPPEPIRSDSKRPQRRTRLAELPAIALADRNLRSLLAITNLAAPAFTALPLITAMAMNTFGLDAAYVGRMVILQILGTLLANLLWRSIIRRGGFRAVLGAYVLLLLLVYSLGLTTYLLQFSGLLPILYLAMGATVGAQKIGIDSVLVQISPADRLALYGGIFGAGNIMMAAAPLLAGVLLPLLGYPVLFSILPLLAITALPVVRHLRCEAP